MARMTRSSEPERPGPADAGPYAVPRKGWRILRDGVVLAVATYGVLAGIDAVFGWSAGARWWAPGLGVGLAGVVGETCFRLSRHPFSFGSVPLGRWVVRHPRWLAVGQFAVLTAVLGMTGRAGGWNGAPAAVVLAYGAYAVRRRADGSDTDPADG
jgi:hypothetical protein